MVIRFENSMPIDLQLCIEPFAEYIELKKGKMVVIELIVLTDKYNDDFNLALSNSALVIYECRQYEMKIFIDEELKYCTPSDRYT